MAEIQRGLVQMLIDLDRRARPGRESRYRAIQKFVGLLDTVQMSSETVTTTVATPPYQYARQSYRSAVMADAPRAYWQLGEYAPAVTANEENALYAGAYTTGVLKGYDAPGDSEPNLSVYLSATEKITAASSALAIDALAPYTVEAWINMQDASTASIFFVKRITAPSTNAVYMYVLSTLGAVVHGRTAAGVTIEIASSAVATVGSWAHVVATYDGSTSTGAMKVYANGVKSATATSTGSIATTTAQVTLGSIAGFAGGGFYGRISEVATYSAALSSDRVLAHYNAMTTPTATGTSLVAGAGQFR